MTWNAVERIASISRRGPCDSAGGVPAEGAHQRRLISQQDSSWTEGQRDQRIVLKIVVTEHGEVALTWLIAMRLDTTRKPSSCGNLSPSSTRRASTDDPRLRSLAPGGFTPLGGLGGTHRGENGAPHATVLDDQSGDVGHVPVIRLCIGAAHGTADYGGQLWLMSRK